MDDHKIKAILEWKELKMTKGLRLFFGLASYYCKFVRPSQKSLSHLLDLLKKLVYGTSIAITRLES